jgi:uncharacterized UPF0160 family protein
MTTIELNIAGETVSENTLRAATHDGIFHGDEVMATAILWIAKDGDFTITRTRDPELLAQADIVFDVGGGQYDHHMRGGNGMRNNGVPYASAGLIWRDFAPQVLYQVYVPAEHWEEVAQAIDERLIQGIDAIDCGYHIRTENVPTIGLSAIISGYNLNWFQLHSEEARMRQFMRAVEVAKATLLNTITGVFGQILARNSVHLADSPDGGRTLVLDQFLPWQETVVKEMPDALLVVFPDVGGTWRVQVVPKELGTFGARMDLPEAWAGLRGEELQTLTGVADAIFCHPGRFIAGAETREGALELARLALA